MMFHRHRWQVVDRVCAAPVLSIDGNSTRLTMSEAMAERLILGQTTWLLSCFHCGAKRVESALGTSNEFVPHLSTDENRDEKAK